jgi:hypothetical protein
LLDPIAEREPNLPNARLFLRNAYWDRANAQGQFANHDKAVDDWQSAIKLDDGADQPALERFLAAARWEAELKRATPEQNVSADHWFEGARVHARAAAAAADKHEDRLKALYVDRALALLTKAKDVGYFRDAARVKQLETDRAFGVLRQLSQFSQLVEELRMEQRR